jgi:hypothetical protein
VQDEISNVSLLSEPLSSCTPISDSSSDLISYLSIWQNCTTRFIRDTTKHCINFCHIFIVYK